MKQVTIEIDHMADPERIEEQLVKAARAKATALKEEVEAEKRLANLYTFVSKEVNIPFANMDELIERLLPYTSQRIRRNVRVVGESGRRPRTRITEEIVNKMKTMAKTLKKAEIARELEVSYIVVSNAILGKYDHKFKK